MEDTFSFLKHLYRNVLQAVPLPKDVEKYASLLAPRIPDVPLEGPGEVPYSWHQHDVTLLQLSLIQMLASKAENPSTEPAVKRQYVHLVELLQHNGVETTIIQFFDTPDKVLTHLSSKCLSSLVLLQLKCQKEVNSQWLQFCLKTLEGYPVCRMLLPCLTSLICVCKGILRDKDFRHADIPLKLLGPLHPVFGTFCSSLLSATQRQSARQDSESVNLLSCVLDLLEILVALRVELGSTFSLCHHVLSVSLPQALDIVSSPVPYFVKKQFILVLKKCLLHKAGEDFLPSAHPVSHQPDPVLEQHTSVLAEALLGAVSQGWLLQVPVRDRPSNFGGANDTPESSPDLGILGAVSLCALKALEVKLLTGTKISAVTVYLQTFMGQLLPYLKRHLQWSEQVHPCEWVSVTFMEQDDDMLDVAKCLLQMYIQCHSHFSSTEDQMENRSNIFHQMGCNPHCVFLLFLKNVAFDASVLLDFLISSETCFLEYFVRYLKLLKEEWPQFCLICRQFDELGSGLTRTPLSDPLTPSQLQAHTVGALSSCPAEHSCVPVTGGNAIHSAPSHPCDYLSSLDALQRLVAYDSSDNSDSECAEKEPSVIVQTHVADGTDLDKQTGKPQPKTGFGITPATESTASNTHPMLGNQNKLTRCLGELQDAISKLQSKQLFPYNPSALLRLLSQVSALNRETH